jgi:glyoxylase-like metal-dependent hydrolase (beta-lactamase superfamily II)
MKIERKIVGNIKTNVWIVEGESVQGRQPHVVVIDPGDDATTILDAVGSRTADAVLLTHGHFDHLSASDEVADELGTFAYLNEVEKKILPDLCEEVRQYDMEPPTAVIDYTFKDGDVLDLAGMKITVIHTPGHTAGSSGFIIEDPETEELHYFSGDTLFARDIGRTDLFSGDAETLHESIERIAEVLPPQTKVYPGHGPTTTIAAEAASNPAWPSE